MYIVKVREANTQDAQQIKELSEQLGYRVTNEELIFRLDYLLQDNNSVIYVSEVGDKVVGWIHVSRYKTLVSKERATISGLVVDSNFHRQGIGRELVRRAEEWAKTYGFSGIMLRTNVIRKDAHLFYRGIGFENIKTQHVFSKYFPEVT